MGLKVLTSRPSPLDLIFIHGTGGEPMLPIRSSWLACEGMVHVGAATVSRWPHVAERAGQSHSPNRLAIEPTLSPIQTVALAPFPCTHVASTKSFHFPLRKLQMTSNLPSPSGQAARPLTRTGSTRASMWSSRRQQPPQWRLCGPVPCGVDLPGLSHSSSTPSSLSFLTVRGQRLWTEGAIVASSRPFPHGAHRNRWAAFSSGIRSATDVKTVAAAPAAAVAPRRQLASKGHRSCMILRAC